MDDVAWIRWFMVGFFAVFGFWLIAKREKFAKAGYFFHSLCLDEPAQGRLVSAYRNREQNENLPSARMGGTLGVVSFVLAVVAALTHVPVAALYALLVIAMAFVLTRAYVNLRASTARRFASLQVRDPSAIAPWYVWTLVVTTVVLPLLWLRSAPIASVLVTTAGVAIIILARRVASMPALLSGDDLVVETFVDTRLRAVRTISLFALAVAPVYVFISFTGYADSSPRKTIAMGFALLALFVIGALQMSLLRRRPSQAEIATWFHAAP